MGCAASRDAMPAETNGRTYADDSLAHDAVNTSDNYAREHNINTRDNYHTRDNTNITANTNSNNDDGTNDSYKPSYNTHADTDTTTTDNAGYYPDDNAVYGYDLYNDDDKKKTSDGVDAGGTAGDDTTTTETRTQDPNTMQYDEDGFYGVTETEKHNQQLFDNTDTTDSTVINDTVQNEHTSTADKDSTDAAVVTFTETENSTYDTLVNKETTKGNTQDMTTTDNAKETEDVSVARQEENHEMRTTKLNETGGATDMTATDEGLEEEVGDGTRSGDNNDDLAAKESRGKGGDGATGPNIGTTENGDSETETGEAPAKNDDAPAENDDVNNATTTDEGGVEEGDGDGAQPGDNNNDLAAEENCGGGDGEDDSGLDTLAGGAVVAAAADTTVVAAAEGDDEAKQYTANQTTGLSELFRDCRQPPRSSGQQQSRPIVPQGQLYVDTTFTLQNAITDGSARNLKWKRPGEIVQNPQLFTGGSRRFDIGQGSAGTCWFLSTVANIAEHPRLLKQVLPDDAYLVGTPQYDGVFHARFWRFGCWVDVYTDDYLPVIYDTKPWGARSATEDNEMWVAMLEKAFARFHGSYNSIYGGQPGDAYMSLTGGVGERIDFEDNEEVPQKVYQRIKNAVGSGAHVTCVVPDEYDQVNGLVGGHAYSLTGTATAKGVNLLRVRNPWGNTEWTGPWADGRPEWKGVSAQEVPRAVKDDGEFWISLQDFMTFFTQTTICSLTPDFDEDGVSDSLMFVSNVFGEWKGPTAAGFQKRLQNPKILITVPQNLREAATVVQLIQKQENRLQQNLQVRCDVYRVLGDNGTSAVMELMGVNTNVFNPETQCSFRHRMRPGTYAVVPTTIDAGQEREFLIRVFSSCPLSSIREMGSEYILMSCSRDENFKYQGNEYSLKYSMTIFGAWKSGLNSGGQISHQEPHATNPQFLFTVHEGTGVIFHAMQEMQEPRQPVGLRIYPAPEQLPMTINYIVKTYESCPANVNGQQSTFVVSNDVDSHYMLPKGRWVLLLHMDKPNTDKRFALIIRSTSQVDVVGYQTGAN